VVIRPIGSIVSIDPIDSIGPIDSIDSISSIDSIDSIGPIDSIDSIDPIGKQGRKCERNTHFNTRLVISVVQKYRLALYG
jgi:hypothetical protein